VDKENYLFGKMKNKKNMLLKNFFLDRIEIPLFEIDNYNI